METVDMERDMDFDIDDYLATGTISRAEVDIYMDAEAVTLIEALLDERDEAEKALGEDRAMSEGSGLAEIDERLAELEARLLASKSTWTLGPVTDDERTEIEEAFPEPEAPRRPGPTDGDEAWDRYAAAAREWRKEAAKVQRERDIHFVSASVLEVRAGERVAKGASPQTIKKLLGRPHGHKQFDRLVLSAHEVTGKEIAPPIPK